MTIPDGGVTISFQSSPTMAAGTYSTIVRGEAGSLAASANVSVTVKTATGSVQIQRVEPSHVMVGVPVGSVTLEGLGFTGASVVLFDGAPVATFDNGANSLDFEPPNSSWLVAQIHTVQVSDPTNGKSNIATYEVYAPQPGPDLFVGQLTQYMGESLIMNSLVPDLNGDGRADLVMVTFDPNQSIYVPVVRYGQADGTFSAATSLGSFTPQASTTMVLAGDFNGDGYTDLILVSNQASAGASYQVLLNDGTGQFRSGGTGPLPNSASFGVPGAVGDFNHDGKLDFAFGSSANGQALSLLYGNGDGTFSAPVAFGATGGVTYLISASDLNGDGYTDLVYAYSLSAGNQIRMLLSGSGGNFTDTQIAGCPARQRGLSLATSTATISRIFSPLIQGAWGRLTSAPGMAHSRARGKRSWRPTFTSSRLPSSREILIMMGTSTSLPERSCPARMKSCSSLATAWAASPGNPSSAITRSHCRLET